MAVSLTLEQARNRTKTVTRRTGTSWLKLRPGDRLTLCEKVMGLRKGEKVKPVVTVEVTGVRREPLNAITPADVTAEGFPQMTPAEFVTFFCDTHRGATPQTEVTRIAWRYLDRPHTGRPARKRDHEGRGGTR
jgi:hypothetical protein